MFHHRYEKLFWCLSIAVFLIIRFLLGKLFAESSIVAALFFFIGLHWFVMPFLLGKTMHSSTNVLDKLEKGKDDLVRLIFFVFGCFLVIGSLTGG